MGDQRALRRLLKHRLEVQITLYRPLSAYLQGRHELSKLSTK